MLDPYKFAQQKINLPARFFVTQNYKTKGYQIP